MLKCLLNMLCPSKKCRHSAMTLRSCCSRNCIYKMMSSNFFINYSLVGMNFSYRLFGVRLTNTVIERTAGSIFTGGVTLKDLGNDIALLESRGVGGIGCYVVEGLRKVENQKLDNFLDFSTASGCSSCTWPTGCQAW